MPIMMVLTHSLSVRFGYNWCGLSSSWDGWCSCWCYSDSSGWQLQLPETLSWASAKIS